MKSLLLSLALFLFANSVFAGAADQNEINGRIVRIEENYVIVRVENQKIEVDKKYIPKEDLKTGKRISVLVPYQSTK